MTAVAYYFSTHGWALGVSSAGLSLLEDAPLAAFLALRSKKLDIAAVT